LPIKSRRIIRAGYAECIEDMRNAYRVLVWRPEEKYDLESVTINGMIILKFFLTEIVWEDVDRIHALKPVVG
jgi:hypothetical protein